jgi:hypothetical protein
LNLNYSKEIRGHPEKNVAIDGVSHSPLYPARSVFAFFHLPVAGANFTGAVVARARAA